MFPTDPIQRYINLSYAKKTDELAKVYAEEAVRAAQRLSPRSGMYFQELMRAAVRHYEASISAWIEIVREACREAGRRLDEEVRSYILGQVHVMCEAAKVSVARSIASKIKQSAMSAAAGLEQSLVDEAGRQISGIESAISRELTLEKLKEGLKGAQETSQRVEALPSPSIPDGPRAGGLVPAGKWTRDQKIALGVGVFVIVIALATLVLTVTVPEVRLRLGLDKRPEAVQQKAAPDQGSAQQAVPSASSPAVPYKSSSATGNAQTSGPESPAVTGNGNTITVGSATDRHEKRQTPEIAK